MKFPSKWLPNGFNGLAVYIFVPLSLSLPRFFPPSLALCSLYISIARLNGASLNGHFVFICTFFLGSPWANNNNNETSDRMKGTTTMNTCNKCLSKWYIIVVGISDNFHVNRLLAVRSTWYLYLYLSRNTAILSLRIESPQEWGHNWQGEANATATLYSTLEFLLMRFAQADTHLWQRSRFRTATSLRDYF